MLVCLSACHGRHEKIYIEDDERDSATALVSAFKMYEPAASRQLTRGFYSLESNSWRWTARDFAIDFKTPPEAATRGAAVSFDFVIPEVLIRQIPIVRLAASIRGKPIGVRQYTAAGPYTFSAPVPSALCGSSETVVDFHLEKAMPPSGGDTRELGVIAGGAALRTE